MSNEKKDEKEPKKQDVRDLRPKKDVKGGGGFKPQSPSSGGPTTQPGQNPG